MGRQPKSQMELLNEYLRYRKAGVPRNLAWQAVALANPDQNPCDIECAARVLNWLEPGVDVFQKGERGCADCDLGLCVSAVQGQD